MDYLPKSIVLTFPCSAYQAGDYAIVHSNGGSGEIDWDAPHDGRQIPLYPPPSTMRGWGNFPWGRGAWGRGYAEKSITTQVTVGGSWKFGLACYDSLDNEHEGSPGEAEIFAMLTPKPPGVLKVQNYDKNTEIMTFTIE